LGEIFYSDSSSLDSGEEN